MKKILSFILILTILFTFSTIGISEVYRNETVYVNLNYDGSTKEIKVVNHISGASAEKYYIDYGNYEDIKSLVDGLQPIIEKDKVKWDTEILKEKDIYYEANINKELPMIIEIKYFLNGKEIQGKELAGKSGNVKIQIGIRNSSDLTTQIQLPLNLNVFTNIQVENGISSVVGRTMTIVFTHLPLGNQYFTVEAIGKNIELEPIVISSTSSNELIPKDLEENIGEFSQGIDKMADATEELESGSNKLVKGTIDLKDGLKLLGDNISKFFSGFKEIGNRINQLSKGYKDFNSGFGVLNDSILNLTVGIDGLNSGFNQFGEETKIIKEGILGLKEGTYTLNEGLKKLSNGLGELNSNHKNLIALAESLSNSKDPMVKALAEGVIAEGMAIESINKGVNESSIGMNSIYENTDRLHSGYEEYDQGLNSFISSFNQLNTEVKSLPKELNKMYKGHTQLTEGLNTLSTSLGTMDKGFIELNNKLKTLPDEVGNLVEGQQKITEGIGALKEDGFENIKDSMNLLLIESEFGDKKDYTSFVDDKNDHNSTCQILMQTPSIKLEEEKVEIEINEKDNRNFIQRFLDLFRK